MSVTIKDIEALKRDLNIGEHVNYRTPVADFDSENVKRQTNNNDAVIVQKLNHVAVVEYMAKRGRKTAPTRATMPYKEIYMQRIGEKY